MVEWKTSLAGSNEPGVLDKMRVDVHMIGQPPDSEPEQEAPGKVSGPPALRAKEAVLVGGRINYNCITNANRVMIVWKKLIETPKFLKESIQAIRTRVARRHEMVGRSMEVQEREREVDMREDELQEWEAYNRIEEVRVFSPLNCAKVGVPRFSHSHELCVQEPSRVCGAIAAPEGPTEACVGPTEACVGPTEACVGPLVIRVDSVAQNSFVTSVLSSLWRLVSRISTVPESVDPLRFHETGRVFAKRGRESVGRVRRTVSVACSETIGTIRVNGNNMHGLLSFAFLVAYARSSRQKKISRQKLWSAKTRFQRGDSCVKRVRIERERQD